MNRRTNDQILDAVTGDFICDQTNIAPRILAIAQKETRSIRTIQIRYVALPSLMIALILLILSVPQVTSAMRQWFGFLPGVGIVDQTEPIRVLRESISAERGGVTVTVSQLYALPDRTVIRYQVSGIPQSAYPQNLPGSDALGFQNACVEPIYLRLPDGKTLTYSGYNALSSTRNVGQYEQEFTVQPVPAGVDQVTLVMPCIDGTERAAIPDAWELPLTLERSTNPEQILRVIALSTVASATPASVDAKNPSADIPSSDTPGILNPTDVAQASQNGVQVMVEQVVLLPDGGEMLYGKVQWDEQSPYSVVELDRYEIVDARGRTVPHEPVSPDPATMPTPGEPYVPFAFHIKGPLAEQGPLTLKVRQMHANAYYQQIGFALDTGIAPSSSQQWRIDQDIQVGQYLVRILTATRLVDGYQFTFQTDPAVGCVDVYIQDANHVWGECGQGMTKIQYDQNVPTGALWIRIANLEVTLTGDWQTTWLSPETAGQGK